MALKIVKLRDLIENPKNDANPNVQAITNKIYKLIRVIDSTGQSIDHPEEIELVIEITEIGKNE